MRTTLVLNDKLVIEAKRLAAERRTTLSEIVNEALRERLAQPQRGTRDLGAASDFAIPVFRGVGATVDSKPRALADLDEDDDLRPYRR